MTVAVDVDDQGVFMGGSGGVRDFPEDLAGRALVGPDSDLVGIKNLSRAVTVEIEDGRTGHLRREVLRILGPQHGAVAAEDRVGAAGRHADLRNPVAIDVRDRRRATQAAAGKADGPTQLPRAAVQRQRSAVHHRDGGLAVAVEIRHRRETIARSLPHKCARRRIDRSAEDDVLLTSAVEVGHDGEGEPGGAGHRAPDIRARCFPLQHTRGTEDTAAEENLRCPVAVKVGHCRPAPWRVSVAGRHRCRHPPLRPVVAIDDDAVVLRDCDDFRFAVVIQVSEREAAHRGNRCRAVLDGEDFDARASVDNADDAIGRPRTTGLTEGGEHQDRVVGLINLAVAIGVDQAAGHRCHHHLVVLRIWRTHALPFPLQFWLERADDGQDLRRIRSRLDVVGLVDLGDLLTAVDEHVDRRVPERQTAADRDRDDRAAVDRQELCQRGATQHGIDRRVEAPVAIAIDKGQ